MNMQRTDFLYFSIYPLCRIPFQSFPLSFFCCYKTEFLFLHICYYYRLTQLIEVLKHQDRPAIQLICAVLHYNLNSFVSALMLSVLAENEISQNSSSSISIQIENEQKKIEEEKIKERERERAKKKEIF